MRQSQEQIDAKTAEAFGGGGGGGAAAAAPSDVVLEAARSGPGPGRHRLGNPPWATRSAIIPGRHGRGRGQGSSRAIATRNRAAVTSPWRRLRMPIQMTRTLTRALGRVPRYRPVTRGREGGGGLNQACGGSRSRADPVAAEEDPSEPSGAIVCSCRTIARGNQAALDPPARLPTPGSALGRRREKKKKNTGGRSTAKKALKMD